jgi:hypothetical protein
LCAHGFGQRTHAFSLRIALKGEGKLRAVGGERACDAPGNGMVVRDTHDEAALSRHQGSGLCARALNHSRPRSSLEWITYAL